MASASALSPSVSKLDVTNDGEVCTGAKGCGLQHVAKCLGRATEGSADVGSVLLRGGVGGVLGVPSVGHVWRHAHCGDGFRTAVRGLAQALRLSYRVERDSPFLGYACYGRPEGSAALGSSRCAASPPRADLPRCTSPP